MSDAAGVTTGGYSFRFFSPGQVDQILRDGSRGGRNGSHSAIERILKHEPGLERADLWRRIRQLKSFVPGPAHGRSVWNLEDEKILRAGYGNGHLGKQQAVRELVRRHPEWRSHIVWRRAAKLGLTRDRSKQKKHVVRRPWSENDDRVLLNLAGYKHAKLIGKILHRSKTAVLCHLAVLGKSSRVHKEGYARRALAEELHLGTRTVQRLIVEGLLEVRDPRITKRSLDDLLESMRGAGPSPQVHEVEQMASTRDGVSGASHNPVSVEPGTNDATASLTRSSRSRRFWAEAAAALGVGRETAEQYIAKGVLKFCDPRITEKSLRSFCRRCGALINQEFLNEETCAWLKDSMDFVPTADQTAAKKLESLRRHAQVLRRCGGCGRAVRGNAFFRHAKRCQKPNSRAGQNGTTASAALVSESKGTRNKTQATNQLGLFST